MITNLTELVAYFQGLVDWHPDLVEFHYGDSERIQSADRTRINYPILWLETPDIQYRFRSDFDKHYKCFFVLLANTREDDWQGQDELKHQLATVMDHLILKIHEDKGQGILIPDLSSLTADYIFPRFGTDHCVGWRMTIDIRVPIMQCPPTFE